MVFSHASPLTIFLNGRLKPVIELEPKEIHSIWVDAFKVDWSGDLSLVPEPPMRCPLRNPHLAHVKSRSMYDRLCQRFPKFTEANAEFAEMDGLIEARIGSQKRSRKKFTGHEMRFRLLHVSMRHMWFDVLGETLDKFPYTCANDCILEGHTDLLRHLLNTGKVKLNCINLVCIKDYDGINFHKVMNAAADRGHLDILKMLHEAGCRNISEDAMDAAASNGHFDVVKWLHENSPQGCTSFAMDSAASSGHLDIVKWLHENRAEGYSFLAMLYAAESGHLDVIKFLVENCKEQIESFTMNSAGRNGHLELLNWLYERSTEQYRSIMLEDAAHKGFLDVVRWVHERRTEECRTKVIDTAVRARHLDVVKFLLKNNTADLAAETMHTYVTKGRLEHVVWLMDNHAIEYSTTLLTDAIKHKQTKVLRYLLDKRTQDIDDDTLKTCDNLYIAKIVVTARSIDRKRDVLDRAVKDDWNINLIKAIKSSLKAQGKKN